MLKFSFSKNTFNDSPSITTSSKTLSKKIAPIETKKEPAKSLKEKRADKKAKKDSK